MIAERLRASATIKLLQQMHLAFYAEVNARAFAASQHQGILEKQYIAVIEEVQREIEAMEAGSTSGDAIYHYKAMQGRNNGWQEAAWVGTEVRDGSVYVLLLPAGVEALAIADSLEERRSLLAQSDLQDLREKLAEVAGQLRGDTEGRIAQLEDKRAKIDAEISHLKENGLNPLSEREAAMATLDISRRMQTLRAAIAEMPARKRAINRANTETYLDADTTKSAALKLFLQRKEEWDNSDENIVLQTLLRIAEVPEDVAMMRSHLKSVLDNPHSTVSLNERKAMVRFFGDAIELATKVNTEIATSWKQLHTFLTDKHYEQRQSNSRAIQRAQKAAAELRDTLNPTPRDNRLTDLGIQITLRLEPLPWIHTELSQEMPTNKAKATPIVDDIHQPTDDGAAMARNEAVAERDTWLNPRHIRERIERLLATAQQEGRDSIALSEVFEHHPPRYGRLEIDRHLAVAGYHMPSVYQNGWTFSIALNEPNGLVLALLPDPEFVLSGPPAQGIEDLDMRSWTGAPPLLAGNNVDGDHDQENASPPASIQRYRGHIPPNVQPAALHTATTPTTPKPEQGNVAS
jgi:hypothetical protein